MKKTYVLITTVISLVALWGGYLFGNAVLPKNEVSDNPSEIGLKAHAVESFPEYAYEYDTVIDPDVLTANWFADTEYVKNMLESAKSEAMKLNAENTYYFVENAIITLGSYSNYLKYEDTLSVKIGNTVYGAYTEEGSSPIGGGKGYHEIFTTGDYVVRTYAEIVEACEKAKSGEVIFIPSDVSLDLTMEQKATPSGAYIYLKEGVTLASDRGFVREDGTISTGAKLYGTGIVNPSITSNFVYCEKNTRVTGITMQGPDPSKHLEHHFRAFSVSNPPGHDYYYLFPLCSGILLRGDNVEIDNCELSGFSSQAVSVASYENYFHHNYIHHNQTNGLGYGICFGHGGGLIEYNLFNYNRHSIAGSGPADSYYTARYNVEMGESLSHMFDMHGGRDRGDGTNIAGKYVDMYNDTFLSPMNPYYMRGVPVEYQNFYHNIVLNPKRNYNYSFFTGENVKIYDNIFGIEKQTVVK